MISRLIIKRKNYILKHKPGLRVEFGNDYLTK